MVSTIRSRRGEMLVYLLVIIGIVVYSRHQVSVVETRLTLRNCAAIESLKAGQREDAQASIDGDRAFLKMHPHGTKDFPRRVVMKDIHNHQKTKSRYAKRPCVGVGR